MTQPPQSPPPSGSPTPGGSPAASGGLAPNVAAALSYLWITAILFLLLEPYSRDRFVRFHSFQSLIFGIVSFVVSIVLSLIPIIGWIALIFWPLVVLVVWVICIVKAYQNEWFKLPWIGDFSERQAGPA